MCHDQRKESTDFKYDSIIFQHVYLDKYLTPDNSQGETLKQKIS